MTVRESTLLCKRIGILKRSEESVPPGYVAVVEAVNIEFMVD